MNRNSEQPTTPQFRAILVDDEPLARIHLATRLKAHTEIEIVGEAGDVPGAFQLIKEVTPDVIFLDIQMPKHSGFFLLPLLENIDPQPSVVFVTAFDNYAIKAFEANALDYLTKPISPERLSKTIQRLIKKEYRPALPSSVETNQLEIEDLIFLRDGALSMMMKVSEIAAIAAGGDYTRILLTDESGKERKLLMKQTLSNWEERLPAELFCKVSRSLLVNTKAVCRLVKRDQSSSELYLHGLKTPITLTNLESKRLRKVLKLVVQ